MERSRCLYGWGPPSSGRFAARSSCVCRGAGTASACRGTRRCGFLVFAATNRCTRAPARGRAAILAADVTPLAATALGASTAGQVAPRPTGLEGIYDHRLSGRPAAELLFGARVIAHAPKIPGRSLPTTISPKLVTAAAAALVSSWAG